MAGSDDSEDVTVSPAPDPDPGSAPDTRLVERDAPGVSQVPGPDETRTATFGRGCFWGPDARFGAMEGVVRTRVGYAGGTNPDPSYYALGDHTEVVRIEYDPDALSYEELLDVFWENHDWTRQPKRQYRSVVLFHDDEQREAAERRRTALEERTGRSAATAIESLVLCQSSIVG